MVTMQPESTKPWASFRKGHFVRVRAGVGAFMLTHLTISCTCVPAFIAIKAAGHLYSYSSWVMGAVSYSWHSVCLCLCVRKEFSPCLVNHNLTDSSSLFWHKMNNHKGATGNCPRGEFVCVSVCVTHSSPVQACFYERPGKTHMLARTRTQKPCHCSSIFSVCVSHLESWALGCLAPPLGDNHRDLGNTTNPLFLSVMLHPPPPTSPLVLPRFWSMH